MQTSPRTNNTATPVIAVFDAELVKDAVLCLNNEAEFYKAWMALRLNLERKFRKGIFDLAKASPALARIIHEYTKRERVSSYYGVRIEKNDRLEIARQIIMAEWQEWQLGNFHMAGYLKSEAMPLIKKANPKFFSRDAMKFFNCTMKDVSINLEKRELYCIVRNVDFASGKVLSCHVAIYSIGLDWELDYKGRTEA